jgi:hypothetical protein
MKLMGCRSARESELTQHLVADSIDDLGELVVRLEDAPLLTGQGAFVGDIGFPHQPHMRIVDPLGVRSGTKHGSHRFARRLGQYAAIAALHQVVCSKRRGPLSAFRTGLKPAGWSAACRSPVTSERVAGRAP